MGGSSFRDLRAYRDAVALADAVHAEVLGWDSFERWSTGLQLVRSVDSVGANIAEAVGRWHEADKRRIDLGHPIKTLGSHQVSVRIHPEVVATATLNVVPA